MEEERFMVEYNKLIKRIENAEKFLNSETYVGKDKKPHKYQSLEEEINYKDRWVPEYQKLVREASLMISKYKNITGYEMSLEEQMKGYKEIR